MKTHRETLSLVGFVYKHSETSPSSGITWPPIPQQSGCPPLAVPQTGAFGSWPRGAHPAWTEFSRAPATMLSLHYHCHSIPHATEIDSPRKPT